MKICLHIGKLLLIISMKYSFILLFLIFLSCSDSRQKSDNQKETPKALKDNGSVEVYSKRSNTDLVESLYNELIDNTPE